METITFGRRAGRAAAEWALEHTTVVVPESLGGGRPARAGHAPLARAGRAALVDSGRAGGVHASATSASSAKSRRCSRSAEKMPSCASATSIVLVEDKGDVFNNDLHAALELGSLLDVAACMLEAGDRAQGEPRRALPATRLPRARRRALPQALGRPVARQRAGARLEAGPRSRSGSRPRERTSYGCAAGTQCGPPQLRSYG